MSAPTALLLADELGPRGRRRVVIATILASIGLLLLGYVAYGRLSDRGQLEWEKWEPLTRWTVIKFLLDGLANTVRAAAVAGLVALVLGALLALLRLSLTAPVRWFAAVFIEFFRGVPLILLIFFTYFGLRSYDVDITPFRALVLALAVYNGAVFGEIFRAGIRSLDRGQTEAAYAVGLGYWPAMLFVVIPQAVRRMVPAIVSQMVTLLKDTSLGFIITYDDLLRRSRSTREFFDNQLPTMLVVALMYIVVNYSLGRLARWLEVRQRRRFGAGAIVVAGAEDLNQTAVVAASTAGVAGFGGDGGGGGDAPA
ncbi:MAG: amino acid ABC transporter permease [Acidimicrobiales bacterium]|nr:amino acid ABC transporter permease [Acidimicrobiales bacterium]